MNDGRKLSSQEIAATLRDRIRGGHLRPGERLPTQAELAACEIGVCDSTFCSDNSFCPPGQICGIKPDAGAMTQLDYAEAWQWMEPRVA